jgi:MOSC domain-containing protein YiiM
MNSESVKPWVHSVNVSGPLRTLNFAGTEVTTGFFKTARPGVAYARKLGLEGDAQADLSVHGGPEKAVYFYPREHYPVWEAVLDAEALPPGSFGENITSEGLLESEVNIGDILQIGTATFQVIQPRSPCYKLQIRFGRSDMTALFFQQAKPGWYASVIREGTLAAKDKIVLRHRAPEGVTVADVWRYTAQLDADSAARERIRNLELLPEFWKRRIDRHVSH